MDIEAALVSSLDNPEHLWRGMLNNFPAATRTSVLVLATCGRPTELVDWQEAINRVEPSASMHFEESLRTLDDMFIRLERPFHGQDLQSSRVADFRNPSVEEFCLNFLDRNAGVVSSVLSSSPTLPQVRRILTVGSSRVRKVSTYRYPNIAALLRRTPNRAASALSNLLADSDDPMNELPVAVDLYSMLDEAARTAEAAFVETCRNKMAGVDFRTTGISRIVDLGYRARFLPLILGDEYTAWYRQLVSSAMSISEYDSLATLEDAVAGLGLESVDWTEAFEECVEEELDLIDEYSWANDALSQYYRVMEHLSLNPDQDIEQRLEVTRGELYDGQDSDGEGGDDLRPSAQERAGSDDDSQIDAMFQSLLDR